MLLVFVVIDEVLITTEKVTDKLDVTFIQVALSAGFVDETVGAVVSITNELIFNVTLLAEELVTVIVQSE